MKMIKRYSKQFLLLLIVFLTLTPLNILAEPNNDVELNYVALGDSLAAGYLNDSSLPPGKGYPIFIQEGIEEDPAYNVNLNNKGVGGFTTVGVLEQVTKNNEVRNDIADADLITLNIGANDLLGAVGDLEKLDFNDAEAVQKTLENVEIAFEQIEGNLDKTLEEIKTLNDGASIYIMGYYNALHYIEGDTLQGLVASVMGQLNNVMEVYGDSYGAYYVPTFEDFEGKYNEFLPEPDIHPNEAGYEVIGDLFLDQIIPNLGEIETPDTEKPIITLIGDNPMELEVGSTYDEPGATAKDDVDGDVTDAIEISSEVDTSDSGTYEVVYTVSDAAGNQATITRTVNVVEAAEAEDTVAPEIILLGDNPMELEVGSTYDEPGATAEDDVDGDVTEAIEMSGEVDTSTVDKYEVVYTVSDAAGNQAIKTRVVNVVEEAVEPEPEPEGSVDKSALEEKLIDVEGLEATDYTEASWSAFEKALAAANTVASDEDATLDNVDQVLAQLIAAEEGLEEADDPAEPGDKDEPDQDGQVVVKDDNDNETIVGVGSDGGTTNGLGALPNTATSNPLLIAIGAGLSLLGGVLVFIRRRLVL